MLINLMTDWAFLLVILNWPVILVDRKEMLGLGRRMEVEDLLYGFRMLRMKTIGLRTEEDHLCTII